MTDTIETTEGTTPEHHPLRYLTDLYDQAQRLRIGVDNRIRAAAQGADEGEPDPELAEVAGDMLAVERKIFRRMGREIKNHPAWPWLDGVKGIGPTLGTKILGLIGQIETFNTVSMLWAFSGYAVRDGKRERPVKGKKLGYSVRLKTALYLAGDSFVKSRYPYRDLYDTRKERYIRDKQIVVARRLVPEADAPDEELLVSKAMRARLVKLCNEREENAAWTDGHVEAAARRYMVKVFVSHLWEVWREAEGFPTRPPYALEYLNHSTYLDPWHYSTAEKL